MSNIYEQFTGQQPQFAPQPLVNQAGQAFIQPLAPQPQQFQTGLGQAPQQPFQQTFMAPAAFGIDRSLLENQMEMGNALSDNGQAGVSTIIIRKMFMGLTRGQLQQYRRSYDVFVDGTTMQNISDNVDRLGSAALNASNMADLMATSNVIKLSGQAEAAVGISSSWDNDRYMFMMIVDNYRNGKFIRTEFVSGYTDTANVSNLAMCANAIIDPSMQFTINHVSTATRRSTDAMGNPISMIGATASVLTNPNYSDFANTASDLYTMRPGDILKTVDKVDMHRGVAEMTKMTGVNYSESYRDVDATLSRLPMTASDTCGLLPTFTSRIVSGLHSNRLSEHDPMNMDNAGTGQMASIRTAEQPFNQIGFAFVMNRAIANGVTVTSRFTFADLMRLDPTIDDRVSLFGRSYESGVIAFPNANNTDSMGSANSIAMHATHIAQSLLSLMSIAGVVTIGINANNNSGLPEVTIQVVEGMDSDGNLSNRLSVLKSRLISECLNMVSENNMIHYSLDVFASAINDMFIKLQWNGDKTEMLYPCFGSAVTLPIVTNDVSRLTDVASKMNDIVNILKPNTGDEEVFSNGSGSGSQGYFPGYGTGNNSSTY